MPLTHSELVQIAARWLANQGRCSVVLTECSSECWEQPDAIGWHGPVSTLIECKTSLSDFKADARKQFRIMPELGIGRQRYFMAPAGLLTGEDLPAKWGVLEVFCGRVVVAKKPETFSEINGSGEIALLLSCLRRIGQQCPTGVSIKCYTIESRKNRTTLGIEGEASDAVNPLIDLLPAVG